MEISFGRLGGAPVGTDFHAFLICFIVCGYDIIDFKLEEKNYG